MAKPRQGWIVHVEVLVDTPTCVEAADLVCKAVNAIDWEEECEGYFSNLTIKTEFDGLNNWRGRVETT